MNNYNDFKGFSELSLAALSNDDMVSFIKDNQFTFKDGTKNKQEDLYGADEYRKIREAFLEWKLLVDNSCIL